MHLRYKRVLIKLSGGAVAGEADLASILHNWIILRMKL